MRSNRQMPFTLMARLVKGQSVDGSALAHALFGQITKREVPGKRRVGKEIFEQNGRCWWENANRYKGGR